MAAIEHIIAYGLPLLLLGMEQLSSFFHASSLSIIESAHAFWRGPNRFVENVAAAAVHGSHTCAREVVGNHIF